jgi:hypothetical protein
LLNRFAAAGSQCFVAAVLLSAAAVVRADDDDERDPSEQPRDSFILSK